VIELQHIRKTIVDLLVQKQPVLLAIDGYGGSGKSTLAKEIQSEFPGSSIITIDDFVTSKVSPFDRERFLSQVLIPLSKGNAANYQRFDWQKEALLPDWIVVNPNGLAIIEGVSILGEDFSSYYDLRIWIDCPIEVSSKHGMERDRNVYKVNHDRMWKEIWIKGDQEYAKTEPWKRADIIIPVRT
jgi:uridine kinase